MTRKFTAGIRFLTLGLTILFSSSAFAVKISEVELDKLKTYKVETEMGTFHWEYPDGRSGWMSAFDLDGKDWITAGPKQRGVGNHSDYRGLPNAGLDDWGHPSRTASHNKKGTTNQIIGDKEGPNIIIESKSNNIKGRWHCFETHIALEVLEVKGNYHFLYEGTPGGKVHSPGLITADGKKNEFKYDGSVVKSGWFTGDYDWPAGDVGEWYYIIDPNDKFHFWMAQTPATNDPGEMWYQKDNMDLVSFGRRDSKKYKPSSVFTDTSRKFAFGFVSATMDFQAIKKHIETIMTNPFEPKASTNTIKNRISNYSHINTFDILSKNGSAEVSFSGTASMVYLELFNASGQLVDSWNSTGRDHFHKFNNLNKGVYLLKGRIDNKKTTAQTFVQSY